MPVYLLTIHAFASWSEENPRGYVQRGEGLKPPDPARARWRREHASQPPVRFDCSQQALAHRVVPLIAKEFDFRLHACSTTRTHMHTLASFQSPACPCGASARHCIQRCPARHHAEAFLRRLKRKLGQQLALQAGTNGRRYLSRGWDLTPVRTRPHFDHLLTTYLPDHETRENGIFRSYT